MQLKVKDGREYVLGGTHYKAGEMVDAPDKYVRVLTSPKGPLELPAEDSKRRYRRRDMQAEDGNSAA